MTATSDAASSSGYLTGRYMGQSQMAYGSVVAPAPGGVIATLTPGAGNYEVTIYTAFGGVLDIADNVYLVNGATPMGRLVMLPIVNGAPVPQTIPRIIMLDGVPLSVWAVAQGAVLSVYKVLIVATLIA